MAKKIKLHDKTGEQLIPVTRSTTVEMNDGVTLQTAYEGINSSHYTKEEINEMGYLQNYSEYDPTVPSYVKGITQTDITNWNNKLSEHQDLSSYVKWDKDYLEYENTKLIAVNGIYLDGSSSGLYSGGGKITFANNYTLYGDSNGFNISDYVNGLGDDTLYYFPKDKKGTVAITNDITKAINSYVISASYISSSSLNTTLSSYVTSGYYDTSTHKIYLRHGTNVLSEIDANDFIKDGMVDTAYVQGSNLVISFNTDAGKQPVEVPIADIFNPTNYYTKTEIDNAGYLTSHQDLSSYVSKTELNAAGYLTAHQDIKTINGNTITGTGDVTISGLPEVNSTYNGKILQVVDGEWTLVTPLNLYSGTGTPNNTQGNNGDLYMQI